MRRVSRLPGCVSGCVDGCNRDTESKSPSGWRDSDTSVILAASERWRSTGLVGGQLRHRFRPEGVPDRSPATASRTAERQFPAEPTTPTRSMTRRFMVIGKPRGSNNAMPSFMLRNVEGWCGRRPPPCAAASRARRSPGTCGGFEQAHQLGFRAVIARRIDILAPFRAFIAVIGNDDTANSIGRIYACAKWAQFSIASKEEQP